jgi:hypothetical protein
MAIRGGDLSATDVCERHLPKMVGEASSSKMTRYGAILLGPVLKDLPRIGHFIASSVVESLGAKWPRGLTGTRRARTSN